jgi:RimJ/RimL family protein N-acetyltransferase
VNDVTLTGRYASLIPLGEAHAEITQKWRTSGRAYLLNKGAQNVDEQRLWIRSQLARTNVAHFVIRLRESGTPVGMFSLEDIDPTHRRAEPAHFLIGEEELVKPFGPKIAAEATRLLYGHAFDGLGLRRLWGPVASENKGMLAWHRYLGFTVEGTLRDHYYLNSRWQDAIYVGLLDAEYRAVTLPKLTALIGG